MATLTGGPLPLVNEAAKDLADSVVIAVNTTFSIASKIYSSVPGASILYKYIKASHQNDPFRTVLELFLVIFMLWFLWAKRYKPGTEEVKLTEKEIQELCDEWEPEPLVSELTEFEKQELEKSPVIVGSNGPKVTLQSGKTVINLTGYNFLGLLNMESVKEKAVETLRKYGVGSCGPPGFYGTMDVHQELEKNLADFVGTESAIIYSQAFSTISSAIPAFAKRGDIIVADEGISFSVQRGLIASRSIYKFFRHNDMEDLERVLKQIRMDDLRKKRPVTRRFLVVEGIYHNHGDIAPLPELIALKKKYKYRLIIDETLSFGGLGKRGAGITDHYNIPASQVDIISASMATSLAASGGFVCGSTPVVDHQVLSGLSYTFSASLPAILAVTANEGIKQIRDQPQVLLKLRENILVFRSILAGIADAVTLHPASPSESSTGPGSLDSPILHLQLRRKVGTTRLDEEKVLQDVVDQCLKDGVLISRTKYILDQEMFPPEPSIRILVSAGHTKREAEKSAETIKSAFKRVLKGLK